MRRFLRIGCAAIAVSAVATVTAVAPAASQRATSSVSASCSRSLATAEVDPRGLLPLTARSIGHATNAALLFLGRAVTPKAVSARIATIGQARELTARFGCGAQVLRRTVVVRAVLCASAPVKVFYVGRFQTGYRVWQVGR
jgi:hypothetical protein